MKLVFVDKNVICFAEIRTLSFSCLDFYYTSLACQSVVFMVAVWHTQRQEEGIKV